MEQLWLHKSPEKILGEKKILDAQGFATHAVTNWEGEFYTAISCRIRSFSLCLIGS